MDNRILLKEAKELGVEKIMLDYTDMGLHLYKKFGLIEVSNPFTFFALIIIGGSLGLYLMKLV